MQRFRRNLRRWYGKHARDLPWRSSRVPYRVWISEIMLQQTTVTAVVPYFNKFMDRFPDVATLASAEESEVLRHWEGLGYYSRARNIHKTARRIVAEFDGQFPRDVQTLEQLQGIGRYTAGAIASLAFDLPAPIVEANTLRLYSRLLGLTSDPRSTSGQKTLWEFAARIVPRHKPGEFNQALMDIGATVCSPSEPDCGRCPVKSCCAAFAAGKQTEIPLQAARTKITAVTEAAVALDREGCFLLCRQPEGQRWAGLWDFPRFSCGDKHAKITKQRLGRIKSTLQRETEKLVGAEVEIGEMLDQHNHSVTRYRIHLLYFGGVLLSRSSIKPEDEHAWVSPDEFENYPLSVTGRRLAQLLIARGKASSTESRAGN